MEKLFLPKGAMIQGERISITHKGDIQIENNLVPLSIKSLEGNICFIPESEIVTCSHLIAEEGTVEVLAEKVNAELISGKYVKLEIQSLNVSQAIQTKDRASIKGKELKTGEIYANDLEISLEGDLEVHSIETKGDLVISAHNLKVDQIKANKVTLEIMGGMECEKLFSNEDVFVSSGNISIKYLDCQSFTASPEVTGIILVATPEHVKAEGVRGFIRPQEFQALSNNESMNQLPASDSGSKEENLDEMALVEDVVHDVESDHNDPVENDNVPPAMTPEPEVEAAIIDIEDIEPPPIPETASMPSIETIDVQVEEDEEEADVRVAEPLEDSEDLDMEVSELEIPENPSFEDPDHSLDDLSMETLNMDDEEIDEDIGEEEFDMSAISEEEVMSLDMESVEKELDASFAGDFDNLDVLSDEAEMAIDGLEMSEIDQADSDWDIPPVQEAENDSDKEEAENELPSEDNEFKTKELHLPDDDDIESGSLEDIEDFDMVDLSFDNPPISVELLEDENEFADVDLNQEDEEMDEDTMVEQLKITMNQVKDCFPDENYPKFISQIEGYLAERRFKILRKKRNREAVLSSFDRLDNPKISKLAREFYQNLSNYFNDDMEE